MENPDSSFSFGAWLKAARRARGLTQADLARRVGVAEVTVRKIEADERRPSPQVAALVAEQLNLDPATRARFLLAARAEISPDLIPALTAAPAAAPPAPPTPLIGRDDELAALLAALSGDGVRLMTLTGPPGIGKTRLALELAHAARPFVGEVCFVPLAPLGDPELVLATLAQALDVSPAPGEPLLRPLLARLQGRLLLVLDNFEQVLPAAGLVAELLAGAADLKIVVTSRAALRLRAEWEYPVPPLALPGEAAPPEASPAVQLFALRARAVGGAFRLTAANTPAVAAICARLDGLPLAIELAAARTRSLSLAALLERLDRRLDLLTDGPPDLPARQRTLRGAIAWSYELLSPPERRLLAWAGAFVGGFTLEDLEGVLERAAGAGAPSEPAPDTAAALLATLIDHSLVRVAADEQGELRFSTLETIRAFARERLDAAGGAAARRVHAEHFADLAVRLTARFTTDARGLAMARLERELDNLRAAFDWALGAGDQELAVALLDGAHRLWVERGRLAEGRAWASRVLALPGLAGPGPARALALDRAADIALHEGDFARGIALGRASVAIYEGLGDRRGRAEAQTTLAWGVTQHGDNEAGLALTGDTLAYWRETGDPLMFPLALTRFAWVHMRRGALATARPLMEEGLALLRGTAHTWLVGDILWDLSELLRLQGEDARSQELLAESIETLERAAAAGELPALLHMRAWKAYRRGDYLQAAALFDENAGLLRRRGETVDLAWAINHGAAAHHCAGNLAAAETGYNESLALFRTHDHRQGQAAMLHNLGYIARSRGDLAATAASFRASLAIFRAIEYTWSVADAVAGLAAVAAMGGEAALAARLLGAAEAAHAALDASGMLLDPSNVLEVGHTWQEIAAALAPDQIEAARAAGRELTLAEAIDLALGAT